MASGSGKFWSTMTWRSPRRASSSARSCCSGRCSVPLLGFAAAIWVSTAIRDSRSALNQNQDAGGNGQYRQDDALAGEVQPKRLQPGQDQPDGQQYPPDSACKVYSHGILLDESPISPIRQKYTAITYTRHAAWRNWPVSFNAPQQSGHPQQFQLLTKNSTACG